LPRKIAGICGIASQLIAFTMILVVTFNSPWFSWTEYHISVLGVEGSMKTLFNWGLFVTGLLSLIFAIGLRNNLLVSRSGQYGIISLIIGSIGIAAIGIFPRSIDLPHDVASVVFFLFVILAFLLIGTASITASRLKWGLFSLIAGVLMITFWRIPWTWSGDAIPQLLNCLPWSLWTIVFGVMLLKNFSPVDVRQEV
jgi:hypothetical membrane protein